MDAEDDNQKWHRELALVTKSCAVCGCIKLVLSWSQSSLSKFHPTNLSRDLGLLEDLIRKKPCEGHDALISFLTEYDRSYRSQANVQGAPSVILNSYGDKEQARGWIELKYPEWYSPRWDFVLLNPPTAAPLLRRGRQLDSDWVDVEQLRIWTRECLSEHENLCCNPFKVRFTHPAWLIDVLDNCLVPGDGISDYIALSYRWGSTVCLQTETKILDALLQPGAFAQPEFTDLISPIVKHSAGLISMLGERYLWADALCIIQDDRKQTAHQLSLMGAIYASAKFTIIATDGDARYGIPGLKGISQRRNLQQPILDLKGEKYTIHKKVKLSNSHFDKQPYFLRAWTFQEFFLSKRRLIIADNQFHWICSTANFHEDLYGKDPKTTNAYDETARFRISDIISGIPNFREFRGLFDEYNERHLTFPEDALAGVSGIISIMSRSFDGGFIYGLPEMCFESALMWQPTFSVGVSRKRTHSKTDHSMLGVSHLPSWSWLGWKVSPLTIADENSGELYDAYPTTTCITHWYSHETAHASTKRAIRPTFLDFEGNLKNNRLDDQRALAQGWTKETFDAQKHGRPPEYDNSKNGLARLGNVVYQHHRLPGKLFWFPFSLTVVDETSSIIDRPQHPFLSCRTKRGWFQARKNHKEGGNHILQVLGRHGERCGTFTVNSLEFAADFPAADAEESIQVELVAICQRKWPHKDLVDVERSQGIENPKFDDQCYGVLWIEWVDGVAYRKGCGIVGKQSWESHELEEVNLVLG